jgi:predicted Zn-dependent peptidase
MRPTIPTLALAAALAAALIAQAPLAAQQFPSAPPPPAPIKAAQFPPFQEATLTNGVHLLLVENHRLPVLSVSLSFAGGNRYDAAGKEGTADAVALLLTKGAGKRDADAVAAAIEGVGGALSASAGRDFLAVDANALSGDAPLVFELIGDAVIRPAFAEKEVELGRTQALSGLQLEQSQPASIASRFLGKGLYGDHPYGRHPDPASVKAITRDDLVAFQKSRLKPGGALLVLAGDITLSKAKQLAEAAFKGWTGTSVVAAAPAAPPARTATDILLVHRPGSVQSNILVGNLTWAPTDPRVYAVNLVNKVLGGGSDSRLFMILREQKGWTYGAYSRLTRYKGVGFFEASAEVRTEVTDSSLVELLAQVRRIRAEPVPQKEFDDSKSALVGRFPLQVETAEQVAGQVSTARLLGLPNDYVQTYRQKLAAVTPAAAQAAATAAMRPDQALIVVVGDGAKIYEKLRKIAPVKIVSPDGKALTPDDLTVKAVALDLRMDRFVAHSDSFAILLQGNALGYQSSKLETADGGWRYTESTRIATFVQQDVEVRFTDKLVMQSVKETGKQAGQDANVDVTFSNGHAKGTAVTPSQTGPKTVNVDTDVPAGTIDGNLVTVIVPALTWALGARFTVPVFATDKGSVVLYTIAVTGEESVKVPLGTFDVYKADVTGGEQPMAFWIEKAAPNRLIKIAFVGAPIEMHRVR